MRTGSGITTQLLVISTRRSYYPSSFNRSLLQPRKFDVWNSGKGEKKNWWISHWKESMRYRVAIFTVHRNWRMHESHLISRHSIIGIGCTEYFSLHLSDRGGAWHFLRREFRDIKFLGTKICGRTISFLLDQKHTGRRWFLVLTLATVKKNCMRNMKLGWKNAVLYKNIAKRQYLWIIFLINSLGRYRYKYYSEFINRIFEYYLFIFFSRNCIAWITIAGYCCR